MMMTMNTVASIDKLGSPSGNGASSGEDNLVVINDFQYEPQHDNDQVNDHIDDHDQDQDDKYDYEYNDDCGRIDDCHDEDHIDHYHDECYVMREKICFGLTRNFMAD